MEAGTATPETRLRAAALGAATGARTFVAPAALALRGRLGKVAGVAVPLLAATELVADKLPSTPPRSEVLQGLAGRLASGTFAGAVVGGRPGARVGFSMALVGTYTSERVRALLGAATGADDRLLAGAEDGVAIGLAAWGSVDVEPDSNAEAEGLEPDREAEAPREAPLVVVLRGLLAAAAGTAAMTTAQTAFLKATGREPSSAPGEVGRRIIEGVAHRHVPRDRRDALNDAMHTAYGTSWGLGFGLVLGSLRRRVRPWDGLAFGTAVWAVSLVQLPALDLAEPIWRQTPDAIASDLSFHLIYGTVTATIYEVLEAP
jgi:uncharacterized membrane protein